MNYAPSLESRYCDPITPPVIPRLELVIPMPGAWFDEIKAVRMNPGREVSHLVSNLFSYELPWPAQPRNDFPARWSEKLARRPIPETFEWVKALVPIREDVWHCVGKVAEMVGCTAHEVFLKCLARQLELRREEVAARPSSIPKSRKATRPAPVSNVIPFPTARV